MIQVKGVRSGQTFSARPWMEIPFLMDIPTLPIFFVPYPETMVLWIPLSLYTKLPGRSHHDLLKTIDKVWHPDPGSLQVDDGIEHSLARSVIGDVPTPCGLDNINPFFGQKTLPTPQGFPAPLFCLTCRPPGAGQKEPGLPRTGS